MPESSCCVCEEQHRPGPFSTTDPSCGGSNFQFIATHACVRVLLTHRAAKCFARPYSTCRTVLNILRDDRTPYWWFDVFNTNLCDFGTDLSPGGDFVERFSMPLFKLYSGIFGLVVTADQPKERWRSLTPLPAVSFLKHK